MGIQRTGRKVVRMTGHRPYGGDPLVARDGISTETHMEIYRRLVRAGADGMHNHPGPPKPRTG